MSEDSRGSGSGRRPEDGAAGADLLQRHGSAKRPDRDPVHRAPVGMARDTVDALGKLSAALETIEHARGHLYAFHRLSGTGDLALQEAVDALREAGHSALAGQIDEVLVGRDTIAGRWSFELVEDYDAGYWSVFRDVVTEAHRQLGDAPPHLYEARMKHSEQGGSGED